MMVKMPSLSNDFWFGVSTNDEEKSNFVLDRQSEMMRRITARVDSRDMSMFHRMLMVSYLRK